MKKLLPLLIALLLTGCWEVKAQNSAHMLAGVHQVASTSYTFLPTDTLVLTAFCNVSPVPVIMPAASTPGFGKGTIFSVRNECAGAVTITPAGGSLIDGGTSITLTQGQGADIYSDSLNFYTQRGTGGISTGTLANRPTTCTPGQQYNTTDNNGAYLCTTTNTWSSLAGGGNNYQTIEVASVAQTQQPIVNWTAYVTCVNNAGNTSTDCTPNLMVGAGGSNAAGIVPAPGPTLHNPHYVFTEAGQYEAPTAGTAAVQNPLTTGGLSNSAFPFVIGGDVEPAGPNPAVDARYYGVRAVNANVAPAVPGVTVNINSGSATASISSASTF